MTICATAFPMLRELLHAGAEVREIAVALQAKLGAVRRAITGNGLVRGQMDLFADWRPRHVPPAGPGAIHAPAARVYPEFRPEMFSRHLAPADTAPLPQSAQEIADVIGREQTLRLIGGLPRFVSKDSRYPNAKRQEVILYVPKALDESHRLAQLIGLEDALKLVDAFGGEILKPATCQHVIRDFWRRSIPVLAASGMQVPDIAEALGFSEAQVVRELRRTLECRN